MRKQLKANQTLLSGHRATMVGQIFIILCIAIAIVQLTIANAHSQPHHHHHHYYLGRHHQNQNQNQRHNILPSGDSYNVEANKQFVINELHNHDDYQIDGANDDDSDDNDNEYDDEDNDADDYNHDDDDDDDDESQLNAIGLVTRSSRQQIDGLASKSAPVNPLIDSALTKTTTTTTTRTAASKQSTNSKPRRIDWCSVDCSQAVPPTSSYLYQQQQSGPRICASNGRFYGSLCELKRDACASKANGKRLFRVAASYCHQRRNQLPVINQRLHANAYGHNKQTVNGRLHSRHDLRLRPPKHSSKSPLDTSRANVRIIELRKRCQADELHEMKVKLLQHFNGDLESMFRYFDSNGDDLIEARELWPKSNENNQSDNLRYAQIWDDHLNDCPVEFGDLQQIDYNPTSISSRPNENPSKELPQIWRHDHKCWYKLDFPFEPAFVQNPCSLSHLMLFDLRPPNDRFNFRSFEEAFAQALATVTPRKFDQIKHQTKVELRLGESKTLSCISADGLSSLMGGQLTNDGYDGLDDDTKCLWTRYNLNLASLESLDTHLSVEHKRMPSNKNHSSFVDLQLHIKDAQLYLSGQFKCTCHLRRSARNFVHIYTLQVIAEPRVEVRPPVQWALQGSRATFECHHEYIDTSFGENLTVPLRITANPQLNDFSKINWFKDDEPIIDDKRFGSASRMNTADNSDENAAEVNDDTFYSADEPERPPISQVSSRASITMASSRLNLKNLNFPDDSGRYTCKVELPKFNATLSSKSAPLSGSDYGSLLWIKDTITNQQQDRVDRKLLWMFHDNGISIYRLQTDDSQDMELVREINGHSLVDSQVDGNWNQLTLCGGLNQEQVVICEWSDNAVYIDVPHNQNNALNNNNTTASAPNIPTQVGDSSSKKRSMKYVYVGQPNLNRVIVMDGLEFEIVAIINTEPQPRKLFPYKPNKIHLSKWVRRKLSPIASARWLSNPSLVHPLDSLPANSQLYSNRPTGRARRSSPISQDHHQQQQQHHNLATMNANLVQHDIWLLCYGQPLVLDPSGDEHLEDAFYTPSGLVSKLTNANQSSSGGLSGATSASSTILPFTPRLSPGGGRRPSSFGWPSLWSNGAMINPNSKESRLRNRKSVHIIQSTFFPKLLTAHEHRHHHLEDEDYDSGSTSNARSSTSSSARINDTVVGRFKKSTVLTTHHVLSSKVNANRQSKINERAFPRSPASSPQFDLIQDLSVPLKPYPLERNARHKIHHAYIRHYDENRLFRVSMDEYDYDKEIDLQDCDPINLIITAQGQLVVQCRAAITHNLIGQLVLDQLTNSRIEFNANVRAHEAYLSPDHRYLVSIYSEKSDHKLAQNNDTEAANHHRINKQAKKQSSIIYVQLVTISGLKLQYEIKAALDICQCSFIWKDGYYAAIFVSTNHSDQQSEILNLRLTDGRLELMARVPGIINMSRHREQLLVSPELSLAALSTNQGTFVVDLEDNRVSQSLRHFQSPAPTLVWV